MASNEGLTVTMSVAEAQAALEAAQAAAEAAEIAAAAQAAAEKEARTAALKVQIEGLDTQISELEGQRSTLTKELRGLTGRKARKGGQGRRGRPAGSKNKATRKPKTDSESSGRSSETSLRHYVASALTSEPQSATQICEAVQKAGYETDSDNFPTMVAQNLVKLITLRCGNANVANRPERGMYVAGAGMAAYLADPTSAVEKE